ncbi:YhgE/Pip domain-containing protein [Streptomyces sp. NBC_01142]|uniref:YhgE/Pip domain-containing protein n=1 Tax=Streptomyces sp. NBC_01142 TaxID=2975865 RepID=UPI0022553061|nr:YhgE/Pip domain-containing protein [Streptomyces sp. NBC_01142]MCX4822490.1 YhgE/Pip domain-containing protein [Streptomyces sp. NBC_01142]
MRSPILAALELKRFGRGKLPSAALVAILLLPLLYGALYLCSFWDPYGQLDRIPVALVNSDKGATAEGKKITAGDEITEGLLDSKVFDWHEVSAAEARKGVEDGAYYLSLTMPKDFSERIASSSGDSPATGALQVRTNDANNYIVGQISRSVFSEVRTAASTDASRSFLDKIFISFSDIHDATEKAAKGADDLKDGVGKAKKGSKSLSDGLKDAKDGSGKLAGGLTELNKGAGELETGSRKVANGTQVLADKVNGIAANVRPYLKDDGKTIGRTARLVADSSAAARHTLASLVERAPGAATRAHKSADELNDLHKTRCEDAVLPDPAVCSALERAKVTSADVAKAADDVNALVQDNNGVLKKLDGHLEKLQKQADDLAKRSPRLSEDLESSVRDINRLNAGAKKVATGADQLHTGLTSAKTGSVDLDSGVGKLKKGAKSLDGGLFKLADGSTELAGGLNNGVEKIPDYDKKDRDRRTEVMADPVQLANQSLHKAPNYGTGFAPYFIPLSLWVGSMVAYMIIQPLNRRALAVGASAWRIASAGWLPVAAIGLLQVAALMSVLHWGLGLQMAYAAGTVAFLALVTCCFSAIIQWLNARFGAAGRILVLAVLMLQLTSAGGTYPVQTSPAFFNAIHPFLPMTYVVDALRTLITGGGLGPVWQACAVLAAFTAGALALTALTARHKQVWTLDRLHPELTL